MEKGLVMAATMRQRVLGALFLFGVTAAAAPAVAATASPFETETGRTTVPYGWVDFCNRYTGACDGPAIEAASIPATPVNLKVLDQINTSVNTSVQSITDMDHWGVEDRWDYPLDGKGDCEDYALMKRKLLLARGFPRQALLMTVVKDHAGEGHAVLTVRTSKGDLALDNLSDRVMRWDETGYRFVKRQSQEDPNVWVSIGAPVPAPLFTAR